MSKKANWRPMEEAPEFCDVLVRVPPLTAKEGSGTTCVAYWSDGRWWAHNPIDFDCHHVIVSPIGWLPLPEEA